MNETMSCDDVRTVAFEHRRRELGEPSAAMVAEHLANCAGCTAHLASLDRLLRVHPGDDAARVARETIDALWERIEASLPARVQPLTAATPAGRAGPLRALAMRICAVAALIMLTLAWLLPHEPDAAPSEADMRTPHTSPIATAAQADRPMATDAIAHHNRYNAAESPPTSLAASERVPSVVDRPLPTPLPTAMQQAPRVTRHSNARSARAERERLPVVAVEVATAPTMGLVARSVKQRLATADRLQQAGHFLEAVAQMEALIEEQAIAGADAASLRLELARIYERRLGQVRRAAHHLRQFLQAEPDDVAAASAFRELCRLSAHGGMAEPMCPLHVAAMREKSANP